MLARPAHKFGFTVIVMEDKMRTFHRIPLFALLALFFALICAVSAHDTTASTENTTSTQTGCCGIGGALIWERWVGGELKDYGKWYYGKNVVSWLEFPSSEGGMLKLIAINYPLKEGQEFPKLEQGHLWYKVMKPGVMMVLAEQKTPGEEWIFRNGACGLIADTPFDPDAYTDYSIRYIWKDKWDRQGQLSLGHGFWAYFKSGLMPEAMVSTPGSYPFECDPEWAKLTWVNVPIPPEYGKFYGRAHAAGEVWTVTINGVDYSATATEGDPLIDPDSLKFQCPNPNYEP
jgi:hypothetical protein